jgi:glucokinase
MLTLGTGVGGGIVQGGQLVRGAHDMAAEIGHMLLVPDGRRCGCGQRGCVEAYCSAAATGARAAELLAERAEMSGLRAVLQARGVVTAAEVAAQAAAGDGLAQQVWQETCRWIALACISVTHVVDPDVIVLAGGMSAAGAQLLRPVQEAYAAAWWQTTPVVTELALARLGNDAGMIGVAAAAAAGAHGRG